LTDQPFAYVNDNPLNATDPLGLKGWYCLNGESHYYAGDKYGKVGGGKCNTVSRSGSSPIHFGSQSCGLFGCGVDRSLSGTARFGGDVQAGADATALLGLATADPVVTAAGLAVSPLAGTVTTGATCAQAIIDVNKVLGDLNQVATCTTNLTLTAAGGLITTQSGKILWNAGTDLVTRLFNPPPSQRILTTY